MNVTPVITTDSMIIATEIHNAAVELGFDACTTAAMVTLAAAGHLGHWWMPEEWYVFTAEASESLAQVETTFLPSVLAYLSTLFDND